MSGSSAAFSARARSSSSSSSSSTSPSTSLAPSTSYASADPFASFRSFSLRSASAALSLPAYAFWKYDSQTLYTILVVVAFMGFSLWYARSFIGLPARARRCAARDLGST